MKQVTASNEDWQRQEYREACEAADADARDADAVDRDRRDNATLRRQVEVLRGLMTRAHMYTRSAPKLFAEITEALAATAPRTAEGPGTASEQEKE